MIRPSILTPRPSLLLTLLGGLVATLLLSGLLNVAPAFGFPDLAIPQLVGGLFTADPQAAFWIGFTLFFLTGALVFPLLLFLLWTFLPGRPVGFRGAALKGLLWGALLWAVSGLLLPALAALNRIEGLEDPGFFALGAGLLGALGSLLGHLAYGLALALMAAMTQGISPMGTVGWEGYERADLRDSALEAS